MALNDRAFIASMLGMGLDTVESSRLDARTHALVRLAALLSVGGAANSCQACVESALAAGGESDEIVGILIAIAPVVGLPRVVAAAPDLALALGYDVEAALEAPDPQLPGATTP